jgi:rhodanese-related sulfurtransferase
MCEIQMLGGRPWLFAALWAVVFLAERGSGSTNAFSDESSLPLPLVSSTGVWGVCLAHLATGRPGTPCSLEAARGLSVPQRVSRRHLSGRASAAGGALASFFPPGRLFDVFFEQHTYVGHPMGSEHIAWTEFPQEEPDEASTELFVKRVIERVSGNMGTRLVLICRSGKRTLEAARALFAAGFTK